MSFLRSDPSFTQPIHIFDEQLFQAARLQSVLVSVSCEMRLFEPISRYLLRFQVICEIWVNRANIGKNTLLSEISKLLLKLHSKYEQIRVGKAFARFYQNRASWVVIHDREHFTRWAHI